MTDGVVETIIARCLIDHDFIDTLRRNPEKVFNEYRLEPEVRREIESIDIEKIRQFSGFIGKIQHNYLWEFFSGTRLLLRYYNIESDVFVAYRKPQLSLLKTSSRTEKIRSFVNFLKTYLSCNQGLVNSCRGLLEVLQHEEIVWKLTCIEPQIIDEVNILPKTIDWKTLQSAIVRINGEMFIQSYDFNPGVIISQVKEHAFNGVLPKKKSRLFTYWKASNSKDIHLLNLDKFSVHILSKINNKRSIRAVIDNARRSGLQNIMPLAFRDFFEQVSNARIIYLCKR